MPRSVAPDVSAPPPLKAGVATTEFWLTVVGALVTLLAGLGVIGPNWAAKHEQIVQALALLAAVLGPGAYAISRGLAKHGHQLAVADVLTALIAANRDLPRTTAPATGIETVDKDSRLNDSGLAVLALIGAVLAAVGAIWLILGAVHHRFDVVGLILLVIGVVLFWFDGSVGYRGRTRL